MYNSDVDNVAHESWKNTNATHSVEHNAKSQTSQLGGTQFIDLRQEEDWTAAGLGFKASCDMALNLGAHMYAGDKFADAIDRTIRNALTSVKSHGQSGSCWSFCLQPEASDD